MHDRNRPTPITRVDVYCVLAVIIFALSIAIHHDPRLLGEILALPGAWGDSMSAG